MVELKPSKHDPLNVVPAGTLRMLSPSDIKPSANNPRGLFDELSCTRFRRHQVRCFMEQEVRHGEKAVYAGVQA
jgi:hypothetical protein